MADPHHCPPRLETTLRSEADKLQSLYGASALQQPTPGFEPPGARQAICTLGADRASIVNS